MHQISSRWRKPKGRLSKKRILAQERAMARWKKTKSENTSELISESCSNLDINEFEKSPTVEINNTPEPVDLNTLTDFNIKHYTTPGKEITAAEKKLSFFERTDFVNKQAGNNAYTIIHDSVWSDLLKNLACDECDKKELTVSTVGNYGYSSKLVLKCATCDVTYGSSFSSPRLAEERKFNINKRMVEAFLNIGKGHAAMEKFSITLGMQTMDRKTFDKYVQKLFDEGKDIKEKALDMAREKVREQHKILDPTFCDKDVIDIGVSFDGTWHKRGHNSLYCIGCVIDILTGLVIDFVILSKYCHDCTKTAADLGKNSAEFSVWYDAHKDNCEKNFDGSSGAMEVHAADILWKRSIQKCKMRYTVLLSDGDSKTFLHLSKSKVYGDTEISKEECINHVSKRLGTALRNKVKEWRVKGVCLSGKKKGNLTEEIIIKLTNYYRKAIKDNVPEVNKMKTGIFASLYHSMSTNEKPQHQKCPTGSESWCFYNRAMALGLKVPNHTNMKVRLSENVISKILPVYQRLASDEILNRCTSGITQNTNESVHSLIWRYCPKDTFVSRKRVELAALHAVSQFNMGCVASLCLKESDIITSPCLTIAQNRDARRLKQSTYRNTLTYKKRYQDRKFKKNKKAVKQTKKEGVTYAAGSF